MRQKGERKISQRIERTINNSVVLEICRLGRGRIDIVRTILEWISLSFYLQLC
jgi:hypothetical protein